MQALPELQSDLARYAALRRDIHAHPELAFDEHRTAGIVADWLANAGIEVHRGLAGTGVVGVLRAGTSARAIGLRADMDALPLQEANTFAHRSAYDGRMHACGHDGHTAMLLAAAEHLARTRNFDGTVHFIFQPAEEGEGGARVMIEQGLFDRFPMDAVFGMHNWPGLPTGHFAVHRGPVMAGADQFDIVLRGRGAHAAMPHQGADPVVAGAVLVHALQTIVSRNLDPLESGVLSVTRFHAGEAYNIIPEQATLGGTVRTFCARTQLQMEDAMRRACEGIAATFNVDATLEYRRGYPPTINTAQESAVCAQVAARICGKQHVHTDVAPSMGAEDFAFMLRERPGCYVWLGNGAGEGGCMLHNPHYDFNDEVLPIGATYWVKLTERLLNASDDAAHE